MENSKPWYQSRTILLGIATFVVGVITLVGQNAGVLGLDPGVAEIIIMVVGLANVILRRMTDTAIK